jgi:hypothetical protein
MVQINLEGGPHGRVTRLAGTPGEERYWPYPPGPSLERLRGAIRIIENGIFKKNSACNIYFKTLSSGPASRSFDEVWADPTIWIGYDPRTGVPWDGSTTLQNKDVSIGEDAFRRGNTWYVVGVLVHELAHTAGAGGPPSKAASTALKHCGLAALYDGAVGVRANRDNGQRVV